MYGVQMLIYREFLQFIGGNVGICEGSPFGKVVLRLDCPLKWVWIGGEKSDGIFATEVRMFDGSVQILNSCQ